VAPGSAGKTLAQARPAILADLTAAAEKDAVSALVDAIDSGVEAGTSFPDIASQEGLTLTSVGAVAANGQAPGKPPLAGDMLAIAGKAFRHDPSEGPVVEELGGGRMVAVETTEIVPSAPQPLSAVQAFATAGAAQAKALKAARAKADAVVAAVKKGTPFAAAVAAHGLTPPQPIAARRVDTLGRQVPPVVTAFLATPAGTVKVVPADQGWVLLRVDAIEPGDLKAAAPLLAGTRRELAATLPQEMTESFARAAQRDLGVVKNDTTIRQIRQRMTGDAN
jgi:peptidyl-prolyl cis-trans isomerase D